MMFNLIRSGAWMFGDQAHVGVLLIPGTKPFVTLEPCWRDEDDPKETRPGPGCTPWGQYRLVQQHGCPGGEYLWYLRPGPLESDAGLPDEEIPIDEKVFFTVGGSVRDFRQRNILLANTVDFYPTDEAPGRIGRSYQAMRRFHNVLRRLNRPEFAVTIHASPEEALVAFQEAEAKEVVRAMMA